MIKNVREQFPALESGYTFLDNAGGSQILKPVLNRLNDYLINSNAQLGATYKVSQQSTERLQESVEFISQFINAKSSKEIIFGNSTTQLFRNIASSFNKVLQPGDEIIVTNCDHEANIGAWRNLEEYGIKIVEWKINQETYDLEIDTLKNLLNEKTKLLTFTHSSNVVGKINPIKKITKLAHLNNTLVAIDGVAYAPHRRIDVQELDVDLYAFSCYKVFGPHCAVLYGKEKLLRELNNINHFFITQEDIPYKFQPGSPNYELSYSMLGLKDYIEWFTKDEVNNKDLNSRINFFFEQTTIHEEELTKQLLEFLNSKSNVKIIGEKNYSSRKRVSTISFIVNEFKSDKITLQTDKQNIGIRYGDFYARRLINDLGLMDMNGVVRVSIVHYNSKEEIAKLIEVFDSIF